MELNVNAEQRVVDVDPAIPLLSVLREELGLTGTKCGCGIALYGACTVHLDGRPMRACMLRIDAVRVAITTVDGLGKPAAQHVVQQAWTQEQITRCGYSKSGQVRTAAALLMRNSTPPNEEINAAFRGNLCRCVTHSRIRKALKTASAVLIRDASSDSI